MSTPMPRPAPVMSQTCFSVMLDALPSLVDRVGTAVAVVHRLRNHARSVSVEALSMRVLTGTPTRRRSRS